MPNARDVPDGHELRGSARTTGLHCSCVMHAGDTLEILAGSQQHKLLVAVCQASFSLYRYPAFYVCIMHVRYYGTQVSPTPIGDKHVVVNQIKNTETHPRRSDAKQNVGVVQVTRPMAKADALRGPFIKRQVNTYKRTTSRS